MKTLFCDGCRNEILITSNCKTWLEIVRNMYPYIYSVCVYIYIYIYIYILYIYIYILQASFYNSSDHKEKVSSKETQAFKKIITQASEMILFKRVVITIFNKEQK